MNETILSARDIAIEALRDRAGNVSVRLERLLQKHDMKGLDRDLGRELALGIVRHRGTLEAILQMFLAKPTRKLPTPLEEILLVGLYQIVYLDRVPAFAAVNEAVNQAIAHRHKRQSGLVNGLLRAVTRALSPHISGRPPLTRDVIPIDANSYRKIDRPLLPDPSSQPAEYLLGAFSIPTVLGERWLKRGGSLEAVTDLAIHTTLRPPIVLRVNRLKATVDEVVSALNNEGVVGERHENGFSVVLPRGVNVSSLDVLRTGGVQPQDPSASAVVLAAQPEAGMNVLDLCAAPGTKTTHLAELMDDKGAVTAVDVSPFKLDRIETNCERLGITIVTTRLAEEIDSLEENSFDLALVDAPCSNAGVLSRRVEARWRFDPTALVELAKQQEELVLTASKFVKSGGRLVYSVCSTEPEECAELVGKVVQRDATLELVREETIDPGGIDDPLQWYDGGYYAIFDVK